MEFFEGTLCISGKELILSDSNPEGLMTLDTYAFYQKSGRLNVLRRGCYGTPSLIELDSLPAKYRSMVVERYGDPAAHARKQTFASQITLDGEAVAFYSKHTTADGSELPAKNQTQYANEASILNALHNRINSMISMHKSGGRRVSSYWPKAIELVQDKAVHKLFPHSLPTNAQTLRRKYNKYMEEGYYGLIHAGFCNDNSRKVSVVMERLILAMYTMPNKPFAANVYDLYNLFVNGKISVYDQKTGELFDPAVFMKNGQPLELSESTIKNYINQPMNRVVVDESRNDASYNLKKRRPYHRRKSPNYSFSKVSMDDRDLTRKMHNGNTVKAYYAYDVASGAVVGASYSTSKDEELFLDCLRDMFRNVELNGWGIPAEVEVENHLVNKFFDDLAVMFPYLRICNPGNSREKRAEHFNKSKKYSSEKKIGSPVGRWRARHEAYLQPQKKVNDQIVHPTGDYDRIVADDKAAINDYNNGLHRNQKKYPGMSRWDVLCLNMNPDLPRYNRSMLFRYIGFSTQTSIRNSKELTVQYAQYSLPSVDVLAKLQPNNYVVTAYYVPDAAGLIDEVYLYQGDKYICTAQKINPYNEARIEWTDEDKRSYEQQSGYDSHYRKAVKEGKADIGKVGILSPEDLEVVEAAAPVAAPAPPVQKDSFNVDDLLNEWDPDAVRNEAYNNF